METIPHGVLPPATKHEHPTGLPTAIPTAGELDPQIVDSPDAMSDGTFPSPAQSPVRRSDGAGDRQDQMGRVPNVEMSRATSPFPLQGPIVLSQTVDHPKGNASSSPLSAVTTSQNDQASVIEEAGNAGHVEKESTAGSRLSMRAAPASPSPSHAPSPSLSRRASSQALPTTPTTIQILQNGKLVESEIDTPDISSTDSDQVSVSRSVSLAGKTRPRSATTTGSGSSMRSRRPSTLIPQPGREGETIPPRYRGVDGVDAAEGSAVQEDDNAVDVMETETTPVNSTESTTASRDAEVDAVGGDEQQEVEEVRQPRVIVRDFGFAASDPRYRGAFHPIPGEDEDEDDDRSTAGSTASGASSGWNRFTGGVRRKSSLGGGWSGFGFGGFGFGGLSRRFSKSSRRGSQAGLSNADGGDDAESNRSGGGSRRSSLAVGASAGSGKSPSPGGIVLPPLGPDTDVSLSDLTPSSSVDDESSFGRQYVFGAGGGSLMKRGNSSGSRIRALSGAGSESAVHPTASGSVTPITIPEGTRMDSFARPLATATAEDARLSILSQVSEEGQSDASSADEAAKWPSDSANGNSSVSSGTTVTAREPRGRYTVLYEFEAEGEHEMSVAEGEVLLVGGRWGNMGWVIAERLNARDGQVAKGLVPEGYLGDKLSDR